MLPEGEVASRSSCLHAGCQQLSGTRKMLCSGITRCSKTLDCQVGTRGI